MAKGHLLITQPPREDEEQLTQTRPSCWRLLTVTDAVNLISGLQLALVVGYLLHLTMGHETYDYVNQSKRVNITIAVALILIFVVMVSCLLDAHKV
jgi:hypothetical protein